MSFGRAPNHDTIVANHVNVESLAWHNIRMSKFFTSSGQNAAPVSGTSSSNPWNNFQNQMRACGEETSTEKSRRLSQEWQSMSREEKATYAKPVPLRRRAGSVSIDDVDPSRVAAATLFSSGCGLSNCLENVGDIMLQRLCAFLFLRSRRKHLIV